MCEQGCLSEVDAVSKLCTLRDTCLSKTGFIRNIRILVSGLMFSMLRPKIQIHFYSHYSLYDIGINLQSLCKLKLRLLISET